MIKKEKIEGLLKTIYLLGPHIAVITDGKNDFFAYDGEFLYRGTPHQHIKVVDSTGAGDAFAASFLSGMIKKKDIEFALQLAAANSESVLQYYGAKNKLLTWKEAAGIIKKNPIKISRRKIR